MFLLKIYIFQYFHEYFLTFLQTFFFKLYLFWFLILIFCEKLSINILNLYIKVDKIKFNLKKKYYLHTFFSVLRKLELFMSSALF